MLHFELISLLLKQFVDQLPNRKKGRYVDNDIIRECIILSCFYVNTDCSFSFIRINTDR
jgi:hypothetical protein